MTAQTCPNGHIGIGPSKFCPECGARTVSVGSRADVGPESASATFGRACSEGHPVADDDSFCGVCGTSVVPEVGNFAPPSSPGWPNVLPPPPGFEVTDPPILPPPPPDAPPSPPTPTVDPTAMRAPKTFWWASLWATVITICLVAGWVVIIEVTK